jgi:CheY-like chemotaxis protein
MNGLELASAIKERTPTTRIMLVTAYATPALAKQARAQQVDYYLPKPFAIEHFEWMVREALRGAA